MDTRIAEAIAQGLINRYLPQNDVFGMRVWSFQWMHSRRVLGECWQRRHIIKLSMPCTAINSIEQVTDTILHEIAHAKAGYEAGHGRKWQMVARSLGARPERCGAGVAPQGSWYAICPNCGHEHQAYRRRTRSVSCGTQTCKSSATPQSQRLLTFVKRAK